MAREQYLLDDKDDLFSNRTVVQAKPKTFRSKWENFWYYHKWHVVVAVFLLFVTLFTIYDIRSKEHPDYEIGMITQVTYPADAVEGLEAQLAKYGTDLNGDGKVTVHINEYSYGSSSSEETGDPNIMMATYTKITTDLSNGTSMIFITDDASFASAQEQFHMFAYLDGTTPAESAKDYEKMRVSLKDCKALSNFKIKKSDLQSNDVFKGLSVSMRVIQDSQLSKQKDKTEYYSNSKKVFDQIVKK